MPAPTAMSLRLAMAVPCAIAALAAGEPPPSNCRMLASMQCLANRPSALATCGVVCATFGGVTETPMLILRTSLQSCAAAGHAPSARTSVAATRKKRAARPPLDGLLIGAASLGAVADGDAAAGGLDRGAGELEIHHLLEGRLLRRLDVAD